MYARSILTFVAVLAACALMPAGAPALNLTNSFTSSNESWMSTSANGCFDPPVAATWQAGAGNPDGALVDTDHDAGDLCPWYFTSVGPGGDRVANYGGTVSFDIYVTGMPDRFAHLNLVDAEGKGLYAAKAPAPLPNTWTSFTFTLVEGPPNSWLFSADGGDTTTPATQANMFDVLANLNHVEILGDMRSGDSGAQTRLDNVSFQEPAVPLDSDGDGVTNALDSCPLEPGPASNDGCPVSSNDQACTAATDALDKARAKLKKLKKHDASKSAIKKAKAKVKKDQQAVAAAC
ncbi:MAG: Laminin [Solirubrobacterales bacterium]|jgi:hypothetical protein|nr:Laminin [Solirubrobacterales bacterium]